MDEGYTFVRREQLSRYAVLQMDEKGRDVDGFVKEADTQIGNRVKLPEGYRMEWARSRISSAPWRVWLSLCR